MDRRFSSFEQIELIAQDPGKATIRELRACLKELQTGQPPASSPELQQRWQRTHDLIAASLNGRLIHRRFLAGLSFGAVVVLLILVDLLLRWSKA